MKNKEQAFDMFNSYKPEAEIKKKKRIKIPRNDRGEYFPIESSVY